MPVERSCEECGAAFTVATHRANHVPRSGRFCSKRCRARWQYRAGALRICGHDVCGPAHPAYKNGSRTKVGPRRGLPEANVVLNRAIANGTVVRQPCSECGHEDAEGHHEDYGRPLEVIWLCRPCHRERDAALRLERGVSRLSPIPPAREPRQVKWPHVVAAARSLGPGPVSPAVIRRLLLERGISVTYQGIRQILLKRLVA